MKKVPVFIVDDHVLFSEVLSKFFVESLRFELLGSFTNGNDFLGFLTENSYDDKAVIILDINLPGLNGIEIHKIVSIGYPNLGTVFLSSYHNDAFISQIMERKAGSFLVKDCSLSELQEAIEQVYHFNHFISEAVLKAIKWKKDQSRIPNDIRLAVKLSKREKEVLKLICEEFNSNEIANRLFLSLRTIENHRNSLLHKIGAVNTVGLVAYAIKNNLFFPA